MGRGVITKPWAIAHWLVLVCRPLSFDQAGVRANSRRYEEEHIGEAANAGCLRLPALDPFEQIGDK